MATGVPHGTPGGWEPIPIDGKVVNLGRWAVDEYDKKQHAQLEFKGVWTALRQQVVGKRYWLTLEAADEGVSNKYEAKVLEKGNGDKVLEEFKPLLQAQA